jgi:hypothetical protein
MLPRLGLRAPIRHAGSSLRYAGAAPSTWSPSLCQSVQGHCHAQRSIKSTRLASVSARSTPFLRVNTYCPLWLESSSSPVWVSVNVVDPYPLLSLVVCTLSSRSTCSRTWNRRPGLSARPDYFVSLLKRVVSIQSSPVWVSVNVVDPYPLLSLVVCTLLVVPLCAFTCTTLRSDELCVKVYRVIVTLSVA